MIPRPQMPLRRIRLPKVIDHIKELDNFFGRNMIPLWFCKTIEMTPEDHGMYHQGYYRKIGSTPFVWLPNYFRDKDSGYTIYYTVVNMMDYCERLLSTFYNMPQRIESIVREIQDRFMLLCIYMEAKNCYDDSSLRKKDESMGCSPFELYRPRKELAFTIESLPDLFIHVFHCGYWGDDSEEIFDSPLDNKILSMLKKIIPNPCKGRSLTEIVSDAWMNRSNKKSKKKLSQKNGEIFMDINVRIIMAGLLGIYEHSEIKANTGVRLRLYRWFYMSFPGKETFTRWYCENTHLILYVMRDFLFFSISHITSLKRFMESRYYWYFLTHNTFEAMDYVRKYVNQHVGDGMYMHPLVDEMGRTVMDQFLTERYFYSIREEEEFEGIHLHREHAWYSNLNDFLMQANKLCLNFSNRPMEKSFVEKVFGIMLRLDCEEENKKRNKKNQGSEQDVPTSNEGRRFGKREEEILEDSVHSISNFDESKYGYDQLALTYGLQMKTMKKLMEARKLMVMETKRSKLATVIEEIKKKQPYDYAVLRCLYISFKKKIDVSITPLPRFMLKKQIETLNELYQVPEDLPLPAMAGLYYFCTSCGSITTHVVGDRKQKKKDLSVKKDGENWEEEKTKQENKEENVRELSMYFTGIALDTESGEVYCYAKNNKDLKDTKTSELEHYIDGMSNASKFVSNKRKKNPKKNASSDMTMDIINTKKKMMRKNNKMDKEIFSDDEELDAKNSNSNHIKVLLSDTFGHLTCFKKMLYMSSRCSDRALMPFNALGKMVTTDANGPTFMCPYCASYSVYGRKNIRDADGHISCGCMQRNFSWRFMCELCTRPCGNTVYLRWIVDDECKQEIDGRQENIVRPVVICKRHKTEALRLYKGILTLSKVKYVIKHRLKCNTSSDGSQGFVEDSFEQDVK